MKNAIRRFYNYFFDADRVLSSNRLAWIDYAKGLTIILVVYHHAYLTLIHSGVKVSPWLINANISVYSFRMPLFFILSGLFIARGLSKRGFKKYTGYRAKYLLYPYILWAFIQATVGLVFSQYVRDSLGLKSYLVIFYQPSATSQFWYLITLFNTAILYAFLSAKLRFSPWQQLILGVVLYLLSPFVAFNSMVQYTTRFYVYIVFGSLISDFILSKENFKTISSLKYFFPLLILMVVSQYYLFKHQYLYSLELNFDANKFNLTNLLLHFWGMIKFVGIVIIGCAFMLNLCTFFQRIAKATFIRVVGYHSLYIYILHVLIVVSCRVIFVNWLQYTNAYVILPIQIVTGMLGSVMLYNVCRRSGLNFLFELDTEAFKQFINRINIFPKYQKI